MSINPWEPVQIIIAPAGGIEAAAAVAGHVAAADPHAQYLTDAEGNARYVPLAGGVVLTDAAQTIGTATVSDITWTDAEVSDPDNWISDAGATVTVPAGKGGRYMISYTGLWSAPVTSAAVTLLVNGGYVIEARDSPGVFPAPWTNITLLRTLVAGQALKFSVYQTSGSNKTVTSRLEICPV